MASTATRPFAPFEWMLAGRYLRTRRREGFVSVIAGFSFVGSARGRDADRRAVRDERLPQGAL
jgi:lipoprotein-releasing system permease protein